MRANYVVHRNDPLRPRARNASGTPFSLASRPDARRIFSAPRLRPPALCTPLSISLRLSVFLSVYLRWRLSACGSGNWHDWYTSRHQNQGGLRLALKRAFKPLSGVFPPSRSLKKCSFPLAHGAPEIWRGRTLLALSLLHALGHRGCWDVCCSHRCLPRQPASQPSPFLRVRKYGDAGGKPENRARNLCTLHLLTHSHKHTHTGAARTHTHA